MASIKKSNIFPWRKSAEYLSDMSEKGLHIQKIGVFKNIFEKDGGKRYIYISVPKTQGETLPENWEFLTERKKICYYRKKINSGCVCEKRRFSFKKLESEVEWLEEKSKGKMLLCGRCGKEYIFEKVKRGRDIEYDIECVKNSESRSEIIEKMTSEGWYYTAFSENGDKLYFARKKDGAKEKQRRKLLTALWASMLVAVASVVTFIAMGIYTAVTVYKNVISDLSKRTDSFLGYYPEKINEFFDIFTTADGEIKKSKFQKFTKEFFTKRSLSELFKDFWIGVKLIFGILK